MTNISYVQQSLQAILSIHSDEHLLWIYLNNQTHIADLDLDNF